MCAPIFMAETAISSPMPPDTMTKGMSRPLCWTSLRVRRAELRKVVIGQDEIPAAVSESSPHALGRFDALKGNVVTALA